MKKLIIGLAAIILLASAQATAENYDGIAAHGVGTMNYVNLISPYQNWQLWPGTGKMYEGTSPHGAYLTTYVNPEAMQALEGKAGEMPPGAVVVKENYSKEKKLAAVTVMRKVQGFAPDSGDWFYLKYNPHNNEVQASGDVESCRSCHAKVKNNDWLFTGSLK